MEKLERAEDFPVISSGEIVSDIPKPLEKVAKGVAETKETIVGRLESFLPGFEKTEIVSNLEMVEGVANCLEKTRKFRYEKWCKLSLEQREELLNKVEQKIAAMFYRFWLNAI